jgi:acyl-CoA reductase-like NAD-dependent aldehyde dehydrogenase
MDQLKPEGQFIGGAFVHNHRGEVIPVENPATGETVGVVARGTAAEVDEAVSSAAAALPAWSGLAVAERARLLDAVADGLESRADEIAGTIAREVGMPVKLARLIQTNLPIKTFRLTAQLAREHAFEREIGSSRVVLEPVGVVAAITPWNYPLHQIAAKVAPALAAGCTVVLKPSELAPLNALILAQVARDAGLPAGVLNVVFGTGPEVGEPLARHPAVQMISFTGSTGTGKLLARIAADDIKRLSLELGGKSASVVLDDADFAKAVKATVGNCFLNSGQTCSALTRLIVPAEKLDEVCELAAASAATFTLGDPLDPATRMGPLISAAQREKVMGFIGGAVKDGARMVAGGAEPVSGLGAGYFVRGTVFSQVDPNSTLAQEEVFGPVLSIMAARDENEAVAMANNSRYGLAGAVWSADRDRATSVARRIRTGQIDINGARFNELAPFGGFKQSGYGRELGPFGLEAFLETKALQF